MDETGPHTFRVHRSTPPRLHQYQQPLNTPLYLTFPPFTIMAATSLAELEALKAAAEGQQCRRAPPLLAGSDPKRRRTDGQQRPDDDEEHAEGAVGRFSYAAADAIAAGSACLLASCGFNRCAVVMTTSSGADTTNTHPRTPCVGGACMRDWYRLVCICPSPPTRL